MKTLHVPVLYGSQTGNSQGAAENLAASLPKELSTSSLTVTSTVMELDDFLENSRAAWTPLCVIVCSSYGVGQAPMGAWKFRELCDLILEKDDFVNQLKGIQYAMLGLGDSKYTTFFLNPTSIDSAMAKAGAERVGSLGKADASGKGDKVQLKVIEDWSQNIVADLKRAVKDLDGLDDTKWQEKEDQVSIARYNTGDLCREIYEDWDKKAKDDATKNMGMMMLPLITAIVVGLYLKSS